MARVGISLGSNLGDRLAHLREAVTRLGPARCGESLRLSPIYETEPVDCLPGSGAFYNAVVEIESPLAPLDLLTFTQSIERELGRPEVRDRNAPRTIDLDLLYYDDLVVALPGLQLPHPRMLQRAFVVLPLASIRSDLVPPSVMQSLDTSGVTRLDLSWW